MVDEDYYRKCRERAAERERIAEVQRQEAEAARKARYVFDTDVVEQEVVPSTPRALVLGRVDGKLAMVPASEAPRKVERGEAPASVEKEDVFTRPRWQHRRVSVERTKPWEALGISRRTWYHRKKEARDGK